MYTDTTNPNHLAHEVIDNSVDEALEGHASRIDVVLSKDGSLKVTDNGRGMRRYSPEEKVSGVELIFTRLHSGANFQTSNIVSLVVCMGWVFLSSTRYLKNWLLPLNVVAMNM